MIARIVGEVQSEDEQDRWDAREDDYRWPAVEIDGVTLISKSRGIEAVDVTEENKPCRDVGAMEEEFPFRCVSEIEEENQGRWSEEKNECRYVVGGMVDEIQCRYEDGMKEETQGRQGEEIKPPWPRYVQVMPQAIHLYLGKCATMS